MPLRAPAAPPRFEQAAELLKLAEKCLEEVNHCYALRFAAFQPGDQLLVTTTIRGFPPNPRRYFVLDVRWTKGDTYRYEVDELTKGGILHKGRHAHPPYPSGRIAIGRCEEPLPEETQREARWARRAAAEKLEAVLQKSDLSMYLPKPPAPPAHRAAPYPFWVR